MKYMMLIKHSEDYRGKEIPKALIEAMGKFIGEKSAQGKFLDGAGLKSTHKGKRIQLHSGKMTVTDGPFTESKEIIGGYGIIDADSDAEALEHAKQFVELHRIHWPEFNGEVELRPFETGAPGSE
jgi:hypothetical protein